MKNYKSIADIRQESSRTVGDYLRIEDGQFHCAKCDYQIGQLDEGVKPNLALRERNIESLGESWISPDLVLSDDIVFREYLCPECAARMTTESCRQGAPVIKEISIDPDSL